jgi:hypothetical protein
MTGTFEWATYPRLLERWFFEQTKELYELEKTLQTPIPDSMHWTRRFEYPWVLSKVLSNLSDPYVVNSGRILAPLGARRILDAGAGATALQFALTKRGNQVTAIDPDQVAVDWINNRHAAWGITQPALLGGFPVLPFKDDEFDIGICISVLEHLPKDQVLPSIRELLRVSRKEVLITMDVVLGNKHPTQMDQSDLNQYMQTLGINIPDPNNRITFQMDGYLFGVACLHLVKN